MSSNQKPVVVVISAVVILAIAVGGLIYIERSLRGPDEQVASKPAIPAGTPSAPLAPPPPPSGSNLPAMPPKGAAGLPKGVPAPPASLNNLGAEDRSAMINKATEALRPAYASLYADFFANAGLSGEQANALLNLLIEDQRETMERMLTIDPTTGRPDLPSAHEMQQRQLKLVEDIRSQYGGDAADKFEEYRKTIPDRSVVMSIQQQASTPLTPQQSSEVTRILYEERQAAMNRAANNPSQLSQEMQAMAARVNERVQGTLAPDQVEAVTQALQRLTNPAARFPGGGNPPAPPANHP